MKGTIMRKLLPAYLVLALGIALAVGAIFDERAKAANLPFFSGAAIQEPSQTTAALNTLIQNILSGVSGVIASQPGPVSGGSDTRTAIAFATTPIPSGTLSLPGQSLRMKCNGILSGSSNSRAVSLSFGSTVLTSGSLTTAKGAWDLDLLITAVTATANYIAYGQVFFESTLVTTMSKQVTNTVLDNLQNALTASCSGQAATTEANGTTMLNFLIEQVK
jgi:hypothetical protein